LSVIADPTTDGDAEPADVVAASVAAYSTHADAFAKAHASKMSNQVQRFSESLATPSRILDAGCGPGRDLARFAAYGHEPHGVELNPVFAEMASMYAPTSRCDLRDIDDRFREGSFDGIWAAASLVHLSAPEATTVIGQFAALLRSGGRLFLDLRTVGETGWLEEPDGRRWYTVWDPDEILTVVVAAGFAVDRFERGSYSEVWATRAP
jgi:SAM-dependent methyltransferase